MKRHLKTTIKLFILVLTLVSVPSLAQARDSLEALRNDLNSAVIQINTLQNQNNNQQNQINALQAQLATFPNFYSIGGNGPAGGIVFHVTDAGTHGLEVAPNDQGAAQWGCIGQSITGADGTAIGTGAQNTTDILAGCNAADIAAQLATEYVWPNGQTDGYLPSKDELNVLYQQKAVVGDFAYGYYWSSSEYDITNARCQNFNDGYQNLCYKYGPYRVRVVRAF